MEGWACPHQEFTNIFNVVNEETVQLNEAVIEKIAQVSAAVRAPCQAVTVLTASYRLLQPVQQVAGPREEAGVGKVVGVEEALVLGHAGLLARIFQGALQITIKLLRGPVQLPTEA